MCLLHGLFGRGQNFGALARRLSAKFRLISLDMRNHGASPHVSGMAYEDMAADVLRTLSGLGALPCNLLAHSMGGKVAMAAALAAPEQVTRLVVADIAPVSYHHHNAGVAAALLALPLSPDLNRRTAEAALEAAVPDQSIRRFLLQNLEFGARPAWRIGLAEIAAGITDIEAWPAEMTALRYDGPVLFVAGERSDYVTPEGLTAAKALFPQARVVRLPGAGHWLHADQPALFADAVEAFLQ